MEHRRCKKKLTAPELFAYRLCRELGVLHPDHLLPQLSWEQLQGWQRYANQEPWGDGRDDQRTLAMIAWLKTPGTWNSDLPDMMYPYFQTVADIRHELEVLGAKAADLRAKKAAQRRDETLAGG